MHPARYLRLALRWWWILALGALIGGGSAYGISQLITPIYRAGATLLVNQTQTPGTLAYNDILTSERLTMTYRELVLARPVLSQVIDAEGLAITPEALAAMTDVSVIPDTQLLRLSVEHAAPEQASSLANAIAQAFIQSNEEAGLARPGTVSIVETATTPSGPVTPRVLLNTVIGVLAGLVVAGAVLLLREYLDDTIASAEDVEAAAALPTLGAVARFPKNARSGLVISSPRRMAAAEAYRVLRTNMRFATLDESAQAIVISSASPGEGKTTTTANLAVAIAQTGQRVIAVDSDLRRPSLHRIFGLGNGAGLTSALISREPQIEQMLQATQFGQLSILSSGPIPPNPSELLSSKRMDAVIQALRRQADIVLFDSPPVLAVADAAIVAGKVDGAMLVVDAGRARSAAVRRAAEALRRSKTKVVGAVLNKLTDRSLGGYQDYHYYSSYVSPSGSNGRRADADGRRDVKEPKEAAVA